MPYAYPQQINHVFDIDHLHVYVTFRRQMQRSAIPQASPPVYDWYPIPARWLLEADEVLTDIISSEWLDEFTLLLTSEEIISEPTGVTLEYAGPDKKLCYNWGKQIEPFGPRESFAGYPTTPALHNSTHENGGADEVNIAGLSGLAADTQHSLVDRGDPASYDFTQATLTCDNAYHDLDLSAIVPAGAKAVFLRVTIKDGTAGMTFVARKNGNVNAYAVSPMRTQVANIYFEGLVLVALDDDGKIEYAISFGMDYVGIVVNGWFF